MVEVVKVGNKWEVRKDRKVIEEFEIDTQMKWEEKLDFINEKIKKYEENT